MKFFVIAFIFFFLQAGNAYACMEVDPFAQWRYKFKSFFGMVRHPVFFDSVPDKLEKDDIVAKMTLHFAEKTPVSIFPSHFYIVDEVIQGDIVKGQRLVISYVVSSCPPFYEYKDGQSGLVVAKK